MAEMTLPCPNCLDEFPVRLRVGELAGYLLPISLRRGDVLAAYLEHAQEVCDARPE